MPMSTQIVFALLSSLSLFCAAANANVQLGPRPAYLVNAMDEGALKEQLLNCSNNTNQRTDFSIGHRGAPLQFPEHTVESYTAAANMGAGIVECDVTFTKDRELVCRHSQCDLHTSTNILAIPELAAKCSQGFTPARIDLQTGKVIAKATAKCCTTDITKDEFLTLKGKMDAADTNATSVEQYLKGTANFRTDLYTEQGTLLTHAQSIELFKELDVKMTPELKSALVAMPYQGDYSQQHYAQQLVDEYKSAGVPAKDVWMQSFHLQDIEYWLSNAPEFGQQAVYLDGRYTSQSFDIAKPASWQPSMSELKSRGVNIIAPPLWMLLQSDGEKIVPSTYAQQASVAGLDIITWTVERSGLLASGGGWYYQSVSKQIDNDGDMYTVLDVLAKDVGVIGVFSDWPATVTYYANCNGL